MDSPCTSSPTGPDARYDRLALQQQLTPWIATYRFAPADRQRMLQACETLCDLLDICPGQTLQARWAVFERDIWAQWVAGRNRPSENRWTWGVWALVIARLVQPSWCLLTQVRIAQWLDRLSIDDPVVQARDRLDNALAAISWASAACHAEALSTGLRLLIAHRYTRLEQITEQDLVAIPARAGQGLDALDAALCSLGILVRTPQRGSSRRLRRARVAPAELVERSDIPDRFRPVTILYLETYATRISDVYVTTRHKTLALGHFWRFMDQQFPEIQSCSEILPVHARAYIPYAIERARLVQRRGATIPGDRSTPHAWLAEVRTFFADLCTWGTEPESPFALYAPRTNPLSRHDLLGIGFEKARKRKAARMAETVFDLEREISNLCLPSVA